MAQGRAGGRACQQLPYLHVDVDGSGGVHILVVTVLLAGINVDFVLHSYSRSIVKRPVLRLSQGEEGEEEKHARVSPPYGHLRGSLSSVGRPSGAANKKFT